MTNLEYVLDKFQPIYSERLDGWGHKGYLKAVKAATAELEDLIDQGAPLQVLEEQAKRILEEERDAQERYNDWASDIEAY